MGECLRRPRQEVALDKTYTVHFIPSLSPNREVYARTILAKSLVSGFDAAEDVDIVERFLDVELSWEVMEGSYGQSRI